MKQFFKDFKEFITKGNILDMAVGVVVGTAFSKIVNSLVADVIMPLVSLLLNGINVTDWKWVIKEAVVENGKVISDATTLTYGNFIQTIIEFLIIALSVFVALRAVMRLQKRLDALKKEKAEEQLPEVPAETTDDILKDIRTLLTTKKEGK